MFLRKVFPQFVRANFCFYKVAFFKLNCIKMVKTQLNVSLSQSAEAIPFFFVISRAHDCLDALQKHRFGAS